MKILAINCNPDLSYEKSKGLDITCDNVQNLQKFLLKFIYKVKDADGSMVNMYTPDLATYLENAYGKSDYSIIYYAWKPTDYGVEMDHTGGYTCPIVLSNGCVWISVRNDANFQNYFHHETMHALTILLNNKGIPVASVMDSTLVNGKYLPYYENDYRITDPLSNFNQQWKLLTPYITMINTTKYPNFNPKDDPLMVGVNPLVMNIAQLVRTKTGIPMKLTSGFRTVEQNRQAGGVANSSHLKGLALDFAVTNSNRQVFLSALINCGVPVFIEDCPDHIHFDIDSSIHRLGDMIISQNG